MFPDGYGTAGVRQDTDLIVAPDTVRSTRCRGNRYQPRMKVSGRGHRFTIVNTINNGRGFTDEIDKSKGIIDPLCRYMVMLQNLFILFGKRPAPMMVFLRHYVIYPVFTAFCIHRKRTVSLRPSVPIREMRICAHEFARFGFDEFYIVGYR